MANHLSLDTEVRFVRGVGPVRAEAFALVGVRTVGDLIEHFPFRHALRPKSLPIGELELGAVSTRLIPKSRARPRIRSTSLSLNALPHAPEN